MNLSVTYSFSTALSHHTRIHLLKEFFFFIKYLKIPQLIAKIMFYCVKSQNFQKIFFYNTRNLPLFILNTHPPLSPISPKLLYFLELLVVGRFPLKRHDSHAIFQTKKEKNSFKNDCILFCIK